MHGHMQFADFVVSEALRLNTRCLQAVGAQRVPLAELREDVERLASLWQMMQWSIGKPAYKSGRARTDRAARLLDAEPDWVAHALVEIGRKLTSDDRAWLSARAEPLFLDGGPEAAPLSPELVDELDELFQADSAVWRDDASLRQVKDADLIEYGIVRAYGKAQRASGRYLEERSDKRSARARRWLGHCVHHMELLQPVLSDTSKTQLWYLQRLRANLQKQQLIAQFVDLAQMKLKPKTVSRIEELAGRRVARLQRRAGKLCERGFAQSPKAFAGRARKAVRKLHLQEVVLLPTG